MAKKQSPVVAKKFKIQFSKSIIFLCVAVYLLCVIGICLSVWRIMQFGIHNFSDALQSPFLIAICIFCIILVTSVLIKSEYIVTDTHFISQYGFIKSKFAIKEITAIVLDSDTKKLTVRFQEQFIVINTSSLWNEDFIRSLLTVNPNIDYSFTLAENTPPKK